jgi:hypothetical protein
MPLPEFCPVVEQRTVGTTEHKDAVLAAGDARSGHHTSRHVLTPPPPLRHWVEFVNVRQKLNVVAILSSAAEHIDAVFVIT